MRTLPRLSCALWWAAVLPAAYTPDQWLYRQRITTASPVTRLTLNREVYDGASEGLADLRVIRDGLEVPFLFSVASATRRTIDVPLGIVNKETRAGTLFVTLELAGPQQREPHNELRLAVTRDDFRSQLTLEASDDGRQWATVRQSAYVFRYRTDQGQAVEHTTLRYPDSRRRYLRLAIANWPDASQFTGATVASDYSAGASRTEIWSVDNPPGVTRNRTTCTVLATGTRVPRDTAELSTLAGHEAFHRSVTVEHSSGGKSWSWLGAGAIYRIPGEESLTLSFPETRLPYQRLCIFQGDDEPVRLGRVRLHGIDRFVSFRSGKPGAYWLYYGARANAPQYDLASTAGADFATSARAGSLGPREDNPAYRPPPEPVKAWTERFPGLLYAVLGVTVAALGWMALRLLRP